jgi:hypothetical protein
MFSVFSFRHNLDNNPGGVVAPLTSFFFEGAVDMGNGDDNDGNKGNNDDDINDDDDDNDNNEDMLFSRATILLTYPS